MTHVIESSDYEDARQRLMKDPVVVKLAGEIPWSDEKMLVSAGIMHEGGGAKFEFMLAVNKEYRKRGGTGGGHIGAIAEAILKIKAAERSA